MIQFFATARHAYTFRDFFDSWGAELRTRVQVRSYEAVSMFRPLPACACVFTDLERLLPWELRFARRLFDELDRFPDHYLVLNDPDRYVGRFQWLRTLHQRGLNDFQVYRLDEARGRTRFPVFLRSDLDHSGSIGDLLHSQVELDRALARLSVRNRTLSKRLMVVEYCDCADADGIFRKYSVMNIHGRLLPRHVLFSANWQTKYPNIVTEATAAEETDFVKSVPHAEQIHDAFRLAGVDYGRIDYGVCRGRIQMWEINTNPVIVPRPEKIDPKRMKAQAESARQVIASLRELSASRSMSDAPSPFRVASMLAWKPVQVFGALYSPLRR